MTDCEQEVNRSRKEFLLERHLSDARLAYGAWREPEEAEEVLQVEAPVQALPPLRLKAKTKR